MMLENSKDEMSKLDDYFAEAKERLDKATKNIDGLVTELCHRAESAETNGDIEEAESLWAIAERLEIPTLERARADVEALANMLIYLLERSNAYARDRVAELLPEEK